MQFTVFQVDCFQINCPLGQTLYRSNCRTVYTRLPFVWYTFNIYLYPEPGHVLYYNYLNEAASNGEHGSIFLTKIAPLSAACGDSVSKFPHVWIDTHVDPTANETVADGVLIQMVVFDHTSTFSSDPSKLMALVIECYTVLWVAKTPYNKVSRLISRFPEQLEKHGTFTIYVNVCVASNTA